MYKILRIICCIISALCLAACVFVFVYLGIVWGITVILGAGVFFAFTVLFKRLQQDEEERKNRDKKANEDGQTPDTDDK